MAKSGTTAAFAAKMMAQSKANRATRNSPEQAPSRTSAPAQRASTKVTAPLKGPKQGY